MKANGESFVFSRWESGVAGFDSILLRVPRLRGKCTYRRVLMGEAARNHIARFYLASAAGVLRAIGFEELSETVQKIAVTITDETNAQQN